MTILLHQLAHSLKLLEVLLSSLFEQRAHNRLGVEALEVHIGLTAAHKHNGCT